jgi:hypothetical protein
MRRVRTARAARRFPSILRLVAKGELNLVGVALIEPLLTPANHEGLIRKACRRSTREIERLVAELSPPAAEPRDRVRALPPASIRPAEPVPTAAANPLPVPAADLIPPPNTASPSVSGTSLMPVEPALFPEAAPSTAERPPAPGAAECAAPEPAAKRRVVFTFTADEEVHGWYERARDLLRHRFPAGDMEDIIGDALRRLVEAELAAHRAKRAKRADDGPATARRSPKWVEDIVWRRDGGRCAYRGPEGLRCGETAWLELDHIIPWARGGRSDDPGNIRLLCRAHNQSEAARLFGEYGAGG